MVGYGVSIEYITKAHEPMLVVMDVVSRKNYLPLGCIMAYTEQKI